MKAWKMERCSEQPETLQDIGGGLFMERRNIKQDGHEADEETGMEAYTDYVCECREVTQDEYNMLRNIEAIDTTAAIDAYTMTLVEEGLL